jgi:hypothetical protein
VRRISIVVTMLHQVVTEALAAQPPDARDKAAAELALTYARLIDDAAPAAKYAAALRWLDGLETTAAAEKYPDLIAAALSAHTVASDLGPKLLAALESLQMSPRARSAVQKGSTGDQPSANPLDQLAERRAGRSRPAGVDAAAP